MKVLVSTTGGVGHIFPAVPLALELRRQGQEIIWATAAESCPILERMGFTARAAGLMPEERTKRFLQENASAFFAVPSRDRRRVAYPGFFALTAAPVMMDSLVPLFDEFQPDLVIRETCELAATPLATSRGIPSVTVAFGGEPPGLALAAGVAASAPLWSRFGLEVPDDLGMYAHAYIHPFAPGLGQRPLRATVYDMRPVSVAGRHDNRPDWLERIGAERPLVYATYGTENGSNAPWTSIIGGLASIDVDAVVTVGRGVELDPVRAMVADRGEGRIRVEAYVPQSMLMDRAAIVISHGGAGTMLAAGLAGVPQLALPRGADQFDNAEAFVRAGAAVEIDVDEVAPSAIADQVSRMLVDHDLTERSGSLAREFEEMPSPAEIAHRLAELVS